MNPMNKRAGRPPLFEVRHSPIHGYGVFALRRIRKGTTVTEYLGDRVTHDEADARYEGKDPNDNHTFLFTVAAKTVIDGGVGGNDARFINHGCDPNCESTKQNKRIYVEAIRTIQPGEELAYDYQIERDPEDPPNVDEIFACRCGAANCRGSMLVAPKRPRKRVVTRASANAHERPNGKANGKTNVKANGKTNGKASVKANGKAYRKAYGRANGKAYGSVNGKSPGRAAKPARKPASDLSRRSRPQSRVSPRLESGLPPRSSSGLPPRGREPNTSRAAASKTVPQTANSKTAPEKSTARSVTRARIPRPRHASG